LEITAFGGIPLALGETVIGNWNLGFPRCARDRVPIEE